MDLITVIILAVTQGITEFLPISSSGHLVAVRVFFGIEDIEGMTLDAFLHLGTLCAVLVYYRSVWFGMARSVFVADEEGKDKRELFAKISIATVPGAVIGYSMQGVIEQFFRSPFAVSIAMLFTAGLLLLGELFTGKPKTIDRATYKDAVLIGLAQVMALIPGVSRSGSTIAAGRMRGLSRKQAASFSFLMSAPIIAGAGLAGLQDILLGSALSGGLLLAGFLTSFVSGLLAISLLLQVVQRISFMPFVVYLVAMSILLGWVAI